MGKKKVNHESENSQILPIVVLENIIITPEIPQPVKIDDPEQQKYIESISKAGGKIFFATTDKNPVQQPSDTIAKFGVIGLVDKVMQMPGAPSLAFVRPLTRGLFRHTVFSVSGQMASVIEIEKIKVPRRFSQQQKALLQRADELFKEVMSYNITPEKDAMELVVKENSENPVQHLYAYMHVAPLSPQQKYEILRCNDFNDLLEEMVLKLDEALQILTLQMSIQEKTHRELSQQQKEMFLRTHIKHIKEELGEGDEESDIEELQKLSREKKWNEETGKHFEKELRKLQRLNINSPEYSVQYSYLDSLLALPWQNYSNKKISLKKVEEVLNRDHFGLEKVKERIIEYMAVIKLRNDLKAPIICLYGPPGVGKTSIGKSIAEATGREYKRISLGGIHDEAEIRGHRRTYIGAMPGRFLHALSKSEYGNPLILLDEIDKVGKDYKGDPSSALLEALDPEQNNTFHDNFIDFPYDLSKVLFIATANDLSTIPAPLRDRMEIIEMSGYIPAEKREIALRHLIKKALNDNGFGESEISLTPEAIDTIIRYYTREAGVRQLEKKIGKILRKIARLKASRKSFAKEITPELVAEYLGKKEVNPDDWEKMEYPGVAIGLAWTPVGGDILYIEVSLSPGKGEKITLTGSLGDVMKESAMIALQYIKAHAYIFGINPEMFGKFDVHIHVPEGAVPKDGPSAGITLTTAIVSAFTGKKMKDKTAMTGEITLRGKVLPVGGIREKIIAARQAGIERIILSEENRKDIEEIPDEYIEALEFVYVKTLTEAVEAALE